MTITWVPRRGQNNLDLLLQVCKGFYRSTRYQSSSCRRNLDRHIVRSPRRYVIFRAFPYAVPTPQLELFLSRLANLVWKLLEEILASDKAISDNPRSDIAGHDQFHLTIGYPPTVTPALVFHLLDLDHSVQIHG